MSSTATTTAVGLRDSNTTGQYVTQQSLITLLGLSPSLLSTLGDHLQRACQVANSMADVQLRAKLGSKNSAGNPVHLPLSNTTRPPLTDHLRDLVARLAEGYFRFSQSGDAKLWDAAQEQFGDALDLEFGYTSSSGYEVRQAMDVSRSSMYLGETAVIRGSNFRGLRRIGLQCSSPRLEVPSPPTARIISDANGDWEATARVLPSQSPSPPEPADVATITARDGDLGTDGERRQEEARVVVFDLRRPPPDA